ncbi:hypothetical protein FOA52_000055 [Chlamydomonas sp. UWO 241]|nr:hypothetical protein FOA52_000055 [Chlamydomonas sp. UWO 241]
MGQSVSQEQIGDLKNLRGEVSATLALFYAEKENLREQLAARDAAREYLASVMPKSFKTVEEYMAAKKKYPSRS